MAHIEAEAVGGYYPFPPQLLQSVAALIEVTGIDTQYASSQRPIAVAVDPCAGDGAALLELARLLWRTDLQDKIGPEVQLYVTELEEGRARALRSRWNRSFGYQAEQKWALHGDGFHVRWNLQGSYNRSTGAGLLWLNPPYGPSPTYGRVEHQWLVRWTEALTPGTGVLVFVVPHYALQASATFLAQHYTEISCWRLPPSEFKGYKQVVVLATRAAHPFPWNAEEHPTTHEIRRWAVAADSIPELGSVHTPVIRWEATTTSGFKAWHLAPIDLSAVQQTLRPGMSSVKGGLEPSRELGLDRTIDDLIGQPLPLAQPPRPAHIGLALAAGFLNSKEVQPDDSGGNMPPILAKGVFEREFQTVDEKTNKDGDVVGLIQVQQPRLTVHVLDLEHYRYHELQPGVEPTGSHLWDEMNVADLLQYYGQGLARLLTEQCPALHNPADPHHQLELPPLALTPYTAQQTAITVLLKLLYRGESPFLMGEVGTGKTLISLAVAVALSPPWWNATRAQLTAQGLKLRHPHLKPLRRVLVQCPPHLLEGWHEQIRLITPAAHVVIVDSISDLEPVYGPQPDLPGDGLTIYLLSREAAKLGHPVQAGVHNRSCPRCGQPVAASADEVVRQRLRCSYVPHTASNLLAQSAIDLARLLITAQGADPWVTQLVAERWLLKHGQSEEHVRQLLLPDERKEQAFTSWMERTNFTSKTPVLHNPLPRLLERLVEHCLEQIMAHQHMPTWSTLVPTLIGNILATSHPRRWRVVQHLLIACLTATPTLHNFEGIASLVTTITQLLWSWPHLVRDELIAAWATELYESTLWNREQYTGPSKVRTAVRELVLTMRDHRQQADVVAQLEAYGADRPERTGGPWADIRRQIKRLESQRCDAAAVAAGTLTQEEIWRRPHPQESGILHIKPHSGELWWDKLQWGTLDGVKAALQALTAGGRWELGDRCNEPLYGAVPAPRRYPLATYIVRHRRRLFGLLVLDEAQEYNNEASAQERAAHRLSELDVPMIMASGSLSSGYSSSMFANLWATSRAFRDEFDRDDVGAFVTRYGYRKILVEGDGSDESATHSWGTYTDRIEGGGTRGKVRSLSEAPGILPLFPFVHLLPRAATIHKADLDHQLPPCYEQGEPVPLTGAVGEELRKRYTETRDELVAHINADRQDDNLRGKLWGAMGEIPSLLDRLTTDTGNIATRPRAYEVRYPRSVGGELVARAEAFPQTTILPKEQWILDKIREELAEERNVILFLVHTGKPTTLYDRWLRLVRECWGDVAAVLDADKVQTRKRIAWINEEVIRKRRRLLIVNPTTVQTGLNNLVYFSTAIWAENPRCDAIVYRQANGRLDRNGQTKPVRIWMPYYAETTQAIALQLLARKVAASLQTDGLNIVSALEAVGAGHQTAVHAMAIGRAIYAELLRGGGHGQPVPHLRSTRES